MNEKQLERMSTGKGFIAALDQSGGSTPKALKLYGVSEDMYSGEEEMYRMVHEMRTRILTSPSFGSEHILGAILFENTMDRMVEGKYTADYLWDVKGIVPFLKVDKGLMQEEQGVQMMKEIPGLDDLLERANKRKIFGTKMRSVIKKADEKGIKMIVDQQFELGMQIAKAGLVPILEPEVDILSKDKEESEKILKKELEKHLEKTPKDTKLMFKVSIPTENGFYSDLMKQPQVVRVVALSGGYSRTEANEKLAKNPGLIASFSRALSEGLNYNQSQADFDKMLAASILDIYNASIK